MGFITKRTNGAILADREGETIPYAIFKVQERGQLFVGPNVRIYQGMIAGEHAHPSDIDVNIYRDKEADEHPRRGARRERHPLAASGDEPREVHRMDAPDELVEVTPKGVRMRKRLLDPNDRYKVERDRKRDLGLIS